MFQKILQAFFFYSTTLFFQAPKLRCIFLSSKIHIAHLPTHQLCIPSYHQDPDISKKNHIMSKMFVLRYVVMYGLRCICTLSTHHHHHHHHCHHLPSSPKFQGNFYHSIPKIKPNQFKNAPKKVTHVQAEERERERERKCNFFRKSIHHHHQHQPDRV